MGNEILHHRGSPVVRPFVYFMVKLVTRAPTPFSFVLYLTVPYKYRLCSKLIGDILNCTVILSIY